MTISMIARTPSNQAGTVAPSELLCELSAAEIKSNPRWEHLLNQRGITNNP